ncbi:YIEGIA domain-containing protein [Bacillus sp. AFS040349]
MLILKRFSKGNIIGDIADVDDGKVEVKDYKLFVDGIYVQTS